MKIILVHIGSVVKYPPVLSLIQNLNDMQVDVNLIGTSIDEYTKKLCKDRGIKLISIDEEYKDNISPLKKMIRMFYLRKRIWNAIESITTDESVIWVSSDLALKHLGKKLLDKKYILHMFELGQNTIFYRKIPWIKMNNKLYANKALAVVQCEYNRAHIAKTWWELDKLPYILPNKPYLESSDYYKNMSITDRNARELIDRIKGKKIILYQGIISKERPLNKMIAAVNELGSDYAFVVMSSGEDIYKGIESSNYYFIPYIKAPFHLEITSHAYIGVLTYIPTKNEFSQLNAIYCAPNKLFEYSMYGIPMLGNSIPGLQCTFDKYNCGVCFDEFSIESIIRAIKKIENNYLEISKSSLEFYIDTDTRKILTRIINDVSNNMELNS